MDVSAPSGDNYPAENMPKKDVERPRVDQPGVSPQEGGYFLNKFLEGDAEKKAAGDATAETKSEPVGDQPSSKEELEANIIAALQEIYDPEIPVNIYELGLIYGVDIDDERRVRVTMTLTTPHCPVAESMPGEVELKVNTVPGVNGCDVALVWEPAWDMSKMTDEARLELGLL
ncbi:SUF system Fe-S cluster assembly protein [Kordiimonas aestuarii]|uniref:SUF system Fe-S cluster assembly protein n=1 Tax=Kordiimonas aestuarii TaxID=1005925 RepID=UPI0021CFBCF5|nr:SUF system Fe-S cluster assembly protein [Kordiimonas aestuarii]